ncbi:MAG: hypothetical protein H6656_18040 [Ardenticatenaceae bacterium]|jgi:predicted transcriptional regulator|nr:hypothetical protein [Anaerolineales bacterium]MCB9009230.1 hypothetical protein [Ardenticatenaceae bacterium]
MNLTRRQEEFVRNLVNLYREMQEPFHYSLLAEKLGVSRFSAYDMLRVLEEKGMVTSEYQLSESKTGPGRSAVLYRPTEQARQVMSQLAGDMIDRGDWDAIKERVLEKVRTNELNEWELVEEMLARTPPEGHGAVAYCVEVMTIVTLRLRRRSGRKLLLDYLPEILPTASANCRANLSLLGGFALGILTDESADAPLWGKELLQHAIRYQQLVIGMEPRLCRQLATQLSNVFAVLHSE